MQKFTLAVLAVLTIGTTAFAAVSLVKFTHAQININLIRSDDSDTKYDKIIDSNIEDDDKQNDKHEPFCGDGSVNDSKEECDNGKVCKVDGDTTPYRCIKDADCADINGRCEWDEKRNTRCRDDCRNKHRSSSSSFFIEPSLSSSSRMSQFSSASSFPSSHSSSSFIFSIFSSASDIISSDSSSLSSQNDSICGDAHTDDNEECDDGNDNDWDECTNNCTKPRCGDGILQDWEQCEEDADCQNGAVCDSCGCQLNEEEREDWNDNEDEWSNDQPDYDVHYSDGYDYGGNYSDDYYNEYDYDGGYGKDFYNEYNDNVEPDIYIGLPIAEPYRPAAPIEPQVISPTIEYDQDDSLYREQEDRQEYEQKVEVMEVITITPEERREEFLEEVKRGRNLGCFTAEGLWTEEKRLCDSNQKKHVQTVIVVEERKMPEPVVQQAIRTKLLGNDFEQRKREKLLATITDTRNRLMTLRNVRTLSPHVDDYLSQSIVWMNQGIDYFGTEDRTIEEVRQMVDPMKNVLAQATILIEQDQTTSALTTSISNIASRTEILLNKFYQAFVALQQEGIILDKNAVNAYIGAANRFHEVKTQCTDASGSCSALDGVLDLLAEAQRFLKETLEQHPNVQQKVEAMFQN